MDPNLFDDLVRRVTNDSNTTGRRAVLAALGGVVVSSGLMTTVDAEGRRKRHRREKRKCLFGQRRCRDRRCHGCCNDQDCGGNVCESGTCSACPQGQRPCRGGCISRDSCCADSECSGGRVCIAGACGCGPNRRECNGVCISSDACCGDDCPVEVCNAENCQGCCDGTTCRDGDSLNFCGRDGDFCQACNFRETCTGAFCACERECCRDVDCIGQNVRCNNQGNCETCIATGDPLPGGCNLQTVGLCCSGQCNNTGCIDET